MNASDTLLVSVTHPRCTHSTLKPLSQSATSWTAHALELPVCQNFLLLYLSLPDLILVLICTPHALCTQKKPLLTQVPRSSPRTLKRSDGGQRNRQPRVLDWKIKNFILCSETIQFMFFCILVVVFFLFCFEKYNHTISGKEKLILIK